MLIEKLSGSDVHQHVISAKTALDALVKASEEMSRADRAMEVGQTAMSAGNWRCHCFLTIHPS